MKTRSSRVIFWLVIVFGALVIWVSFGRLVVYRYKNRVERAIIFSDFNQEECKRYVFKKIFQPETWRDELARRYINNRVRYAKHPAISSLYQYINWPGEIALCSIYFEYATANPANMILTDGFGRF